MSGTDASVEQRKLEIVQRVLRLGDSLDVIALDYGLDRALVQRWLDEAADLISSEYAKVADYDARTRRREHDFRAVFDGSRDAIMLLTEMGFFECNPSTLAMFRVDSFEEFARLHPSDLSPPAQPCGRSSFDLANELIVQALRGGSSQFEWVHRRADGEDFEANVLLSRVEEEGRDFLQATVRDISEMKRMQRALEAMYSELVRSHSAVAEKNNELERLAITDQLTGLVNRRKLEEVMRSQWSVASRNVEPMALILADIDHFKRINDTYGHQAGDAILREITDVMRGAVRHSDLVGRWGGEEFLVICHNTSTAQACDVADRIRQAVRQHSFTVGGTFTCSFGVAGNEGVESIDEMIRIADSGLYRAKAAGRDLVVVGDAVPSLAGLGHSAAERRG